MSHVRALGGSPGHLAEFSSRKKGMYEYCNARNTISVQTLFPTRYRKGWHDWTSKDPLAIELRFRDANSNGSNAMRAIMQRGKNLFMDGNKGEEICPKLYESYEYRLLRYQKDVCKSLLLFSHLRPKSEFTREPRERWVQNRFGLSSLLKMIILSWSDDLNLGKQIDLSSCLCCTGCRKTFIQILSIC